MTKKKYRSRKKSQSKYEQIIVNRKKYSLYKITWEDITGDSGHANTTETKQMMPAVKVTYGFIIEDDGLYLKTAAVKGRELPAQTLPPNLQIYCQSLLYRYCRQF